MSPLVNVARESLMYLEAYYQVHDTRIQRYAKIAQGIIDRIDETRKTQSYSTGEFSLHPETLGFGLGEDSRKLARVLSDVIKGWTAHKDILSTLEYFERWYHLVCTDCTPECLRHAAAFRDDLTTLMRMWTKPISVCPRVVRANLLTKVMLNMPFHTDLTRKLVGIVWGLTRDDNSKPVFSSAADCIDFYADILAETPTAHVDVMSTVLKLLYVHEFGMDSAVDRLTPGHHGG